MLGGCHRKLRRRIWEQCNDEESGSGGVLAGAVLAAHAKRVLLSLHEKRGEPLTACLCPPTFPLCLRALRSKAGLLLAFAGLAAGSAPGRGPCIWDAMCPGGS